jgi:beta-glucanase (GH16 family)
MTILLAALLASAQPATVPPEGYALVWSDEFERPGLPDPKKWDYDTAFNKRGWHNEESQYYSGARRENSRVENGMLIIEARREELRQAGDWGGQKYTSARLITKGKESWKYGYFDIRAKLPCGVGTWPAIWTLPDVPNMKWPDDGEIDIMEHVGHDKGVVHQTIHTGAFNHVMKTHKASQMTVPDVCDAFHNYQLDWTPERLVMSIDGKPNFTFARSDKKSEWPFDLPHYLILNIAIGGAWGGAQGIDDKALPVRMEVDYVRVYQKPGSGER